MSCCGEPTPDLQVGDRIHSTKIIGTTRLGGKEKYTLAYLSNSLIVIHIESASGRDLGDISMSLTEFNENYERCPG